MLPTLLRRRASGQNPFEAIRREMESLWDRFPMPWTRNGGEWEDLTAEYPVDIREDDKDIFVDAEVPGFKKDEIQVTMNQGVLRIQAEHKVEEKKTKGEQHLHERRYTRLERCFTLPAAVDEANVDAKLEDGVLHLTLHKTKEAQPQKVMIK